MNRQSALLSAAAAALDDGRDPFDTSFLVEHEVTLDECYTMGEQMALATRVFLHLSSRRNGQALLATLIGQMAATEAR